MVLTEEQMRTLDTEVKQRGMGIDPAVMPAEEADSYAFTPEATMPEQELPQQYTAPVEQVTEDELYTSDAYITGPTKINPNPAALKVVEFTDKIADNVKKTNIYKRVTYTKEDTLREARDISIETGIPVNAILHSSETMDNARNIYNYRRKQMELMVPGENEVSMDSLMKAYPGLDNIINAGNEVDAAIALQNIKNVRQMTGIVEIAKGNWDIGLLERKMGQTGVKAFREGRAVSEEEYAKYDAIQKQIQEFKETPGFFEDPMMSIVGGTARQIPQQLTGVGTGTLYGGVLAGLAAGATVLAAPATGGASLAAVPAAAKTGFSWGMRAGYAVDMFENSAGQRYIEYSRFKDDNGKRVLTDEEARAYAAAAAAVETGIEFMNAGQILDVLKGNKSAAAKQIRDVVAGATDNATFVAGLKRMLSGATAVAVSESVEEGAQEGADRLISTGVSLYKGTTAIPRYTPEQMLEGALENTLEALPASIGFGLSAAGGGSIGLVQRAARLAEIGNFRYNEEMKNVTGVGMVKTMSENTEVKEFFKKDPDVAKQVLKNTVAGTGYEKVNIDTEMVARQENGLAALRDIGERAGMSVEEIQTAIETGADLTVPTEVYFQMRAENENFAINDDFIAFSDVAPSYARNKYYAEMKKAEIDAIMKDANTRQLEQQMAAIDMIVQDNFAEGIERDAAAAVLTMRPDNPIEGLKEMRGMYKEQLDSILAPVIRELEKGMKQGVDIIRVEGDRDARYERVSNNAEWAREFYKENKRWPTKFELEGMAIDILSGRDFSKLADYQNVPEMQEYYEANAAQIDELLGNIEAFDNIEERIANIDADELQTMEGMSREAYDIYKRESANAITNAPNDAVKRAAKMGAALLAYRADRYAEARREAGDSNYTAADYYKNLINIKYGGVFDGNTHNGLLQESLFQQLENEAEDALTELLFSGTPLQRTENLQKAVGKLDRVELNAVTFKDPESQKYMKQQIVKRSNLNKKDAEKLADDLLNKIGVIVDIAEAFYEKYPDFEAWQNRQITNVEGKMTLEQLQKDDVIRIPVKKGKKTVWVPLISAFRKNGEYPINIDLGTLCMKREAADFLNQILIKKGYAQKLGPTQLEALKTLLKQHGFLTACDVCFVETKRARMLADANKTSYDWLSTLMAAGLDDGHVLGEDRTLTDKQKEALEKMTSTKEIIVDDVPIKEYQLYFKEHMPEGRRRTKKDGDSGADLDTGTTPDKMMKIAKLFKQDPSLAGELSPETLLTTRTVDNLFNRYGGHTDIRTTISGMYGSATAKPLNGFVVYDPLSWLKSMNEGRLNKKSKQANNLEWLYDIGGGRAQSFTDFNPILFVDYVQMIADYEARDMPMHVYTKVPSFVKLFGRTGIMINMSFVPKIVKGVDADHVGLQWNEQTKEWEYAWHEDSFPIEEAYKLRERADFGGRVGIIAVGVSKAQIEKMMTDPRIDMIIPYHKSGMAHSVQVKTGLVNATDYTDYQNTKIPDWHTVAMKYAKMVDPHFEEKMKGDTKSVSKYLKAQKKIIRDKYINYSRILIEKGDPEKAAQTYLDRCRELGCTPVFEMFAYKDGNKEAGVVNPGYYKMLEDFRGYDNDMKYVPQGPVKLELTDDWQEVLDEALGVREAQRKQITNMENNKELLDKAEKILAYQRIDGEIRETMVKRLKGALGDENVQSLRKDEFHDKLESIYKEEGATEEEARGRLEKFRNGDGIVYGFAKNGAIYLNEDYFNANTPAHEFTHVWAKVAQAKNPKLWLKGVGLLENTQEWKNVLNDELYGFGDRQAEIDVMGDSKEAKVLQTQLNNEIASEVLSRIVGEQNEAYIEEMLRPGNKLYKGDGLIAEIKRWVAKVFKEIRSLFDPIDGKPLTYKEFVNMPLKALWDENGQKEFRETVAKTIQQMQENKVQADAIEMQAEQTVFQRQQAMNDTIQGATEFRDNGQRVVTVFDSGNESTIAHELGHVFVADLKDLAEMPNAPEQIKKDWQTIKEWLGYKDSQTKFTTAQQEKFARGFEAYLRTGEAPATGLRKVFQNFKNWLCKIYKDFLSLGGKPSKDVQAVMGRMLATADEVEQAFKLREAEDFEKAGGFDYLAKDSLEMYKRWQKDAQEYAKEKVLKEAMKNLTEQRAKELEAVREKMTEDIRTQLLSTPVYRAELVLSANPKLANDWPAEQFGMTYEEYTEAIETQGTLEEATKKAVDVAMQEVEEGLPLEEIKRDAENAVNTSEYRGMYLAFEQDFIQKKMRRDESLSRQIEQTLADIEREASGIGEEVAEDSAEVKRLKQRIKELKYRARWTEAELKTLNRLERASNKEERMSAIKAVKEMLRNARKNVKVYRDNAVTNYKYIKEYAKENMAQMNVDDATNVAKWTALEKRAGRESVEALKRALDSELRDTKVNDEKVTDAWQKANDAKFRQRVFAEYAAIATRNKAKVQRKNARLQARQKTIERNNNIPANERYMYVHGLYVLGLSKTDAQMPQGEPNIVAMFKEYQDNLQAFFVDEDGNISLPDYILSALSGNTVYNDGYTNLTMEQYDDFVDVLTAIYKAGIDANKVKSMKDINGNTVLISDVAEAVVAEMNERIPAIVRNDITNAGSMTFKESIQDKARRARISLTKPEEILDWMGPTAHRYIYETVNQSWNKERVMLEQAALMVKAIWEPYTNTEKSEMRSKRQFRFGTSILTREEMICVAFNWGTEINRRRIMDGFNVDESTVRELLSNLTQKDWQMVTSVWDLVNSYWPETVRVEESMVGVAPEKQSAMPFEIVGKDGNVYKLNGGYYPIKYDPSKSLTAANQAQDDMAKQFAAGNAAMNRNRGYLKQRTQQKVSRPVLLSFDVLNKHLNNVIHNICFRESLRDVNRIIKNQAVSQAIQDHFGIAQARMFEQWVRDCWAPDVQKKDPVSSAMEFFRHKQTAAVLGYRTTTALLNSLNIFPITDYLGAARTVDALQKFYNNPKENWNFALDRSVFLRERAQTMDRDAGEILRKEFIGGYGKVADTLIRGERAIEAHAFEMLAVTDLALACPLWLSEYQRVYQQNSKNIAEMDEDAITRLEMEAVAAGDKAVRKIFGSGEMKDLAPVQKGTEMTKALTMYYSYFNVVFNSLYGGYAQGRMQAMNEGATTVGGYSLGFRIAPLVQKFAYWTVFTGVAEGILRNAIEVASGGSDDPEEWLKKIAKGVADNVFGTIPVVRDMASMIFDKLMGEKYFSARPLPAYGLLDTGMKLWNTIESKKKTKIDVFREGMRITNGFTGIGNTLTDAVATTAYWADTDFDKPFLEYLSAVIFDKRIDKKKKK